MKQLYTRTALLVAIAVFSFRFLSAQVPVLWGLTCAGGDNNSQGTLFSVNGDGSGFNKAVTFKTTYPGIHPVGKVLQANDGMLYGLTNGGGTHDAGIIFRYNLYTGDYESIYNFSKASGCSPHGSLIQAYDNKLYGMTSEGGLHGVGTIFSLNPANNVFTKLFDFDTVHGANPWGDLLQAADSNLYGMTLNGGDSKLGALFRFDIQTGITAILYNFWVYDDNSYASTCYNPYGSLIQDSTTRLFYGIGYNGAANGLGGIFSFNAASRDFTQLYSFIDYAGGASYGTLLKASNKKFYGTIASGGYDLQGMVFEFNPANNHVRTITDTSVAGFYPKDLVEVNGTLYGLSEGMNYRSGSIFSVKLSSFSYDKRFFFNDNTGYYPWGTLTLADNGQLFGFTGQGPSGYGGTLFTCNPALDTIQTLVVFGQTKIAGPWGSLATHGNGTFYGLTKTGGGAYGHGSVFKYTAGSDTPVIIHQFTKPLGDFYTQAQLTLHSDGNLYGLAGRAGPNHYGSIFKIALPSGTYSECFNFSNAFNYPTGSLFELSNGRLAATTSGGQGIEGSLFAFDPTNNVCGGLKIFLGPSGSYPQGGIFVKDGHTIYGVNTLNGTRGMGNIYRFETNTGVFSEVYGFDFDAEVGEYNAPVMTPDGTLYGTTTNGGITNAGIIYRVATNGDYSKVFDFSKVAGSKPVGAMLVASDGKLYGMTATGGRYDEGVVFRFDPATNQYTKIVELNDTTGSMPNGSLVQYGVANGIENVSEPVWNIFPNPVTDYLSVLADPQLAGSSLELCDLNGRRVFNGQLSSVNYRLSLATVPAGAYVLSISGKNIKANKLVIKQ